MGVNFASHKRNIEYLHQFQRGWLGEPYAVHPFAVADLSWELYKDEDIYLTCLYHDTLEDVIVHPKTREPVPSDLMSGVPLTVSDLRNFIPQHIIDKVACVTNMPYSHMIEIGVHPAIIDHLYLGEEKPQYVNKIRRMAASGDMTVIKTKHCDLSINSSAEDYHRFTEEQKAIYHSLMESRYNVSLQILGDAIKAHENKIDFRFR